MVFSLYSFSRRLVVAAVLCSAVGEASGPVDDSDCNCYLTNGSSPAYFTSHSFFDFRNLSEYAGVPSPLKNSSRTSKAASSSAYFDSDEWTNAWNIQDWDTRGGKAPVLRVNSRNNVYIEKNKDADASSETYLTLRTSRLPGFQSAAELESMATYHYLSLRMKARALGSPGACLAMFTYYAPTDDLEDVQEADLEILTREPRDRIQYTNQPSYSDKGPSLAKATRNASLPGGGRWDKWLEHRLDWTPGGSVWYVAGKEVARIEFQTPRDPAQLFFNAWSDGGVWTGNMSVGGSAYLQMQWIEVVYNSTDGGEERRSLGSAGRGGAGPHGQLMRREGDDDGCKVVCSIDERDEVGSPSVLDSMASRPWAEGGMQGQLVWLGSWVLGVTALLCFT